MRKETVIRRIEILANGFVQVQRATELVEDDGTRTQIGGYHRVAYPPGASLDQEDSFVQRHAAVAWTPEVIETHKTRVKAQAEARIARHRVTT